MEVLDFCGPFLVFSATRVNEEKRYEESSPFKVLLVAERPGPVITTGGMTVLPNHTFENCPRLDILVSPGGLGARKELTNPIMLDWLRTAPRRRNASEPGTVSISNDGATRWTAAPNGTRRYLIEKMSRKELAAIIGALMETRQ
jgi:hypothetical protein